MSSSELSSEYSSEEDKIEDDNYLVNTKQRHLLNKGTTDFKNMLNPIQINSFHEHIIIG